MELEKRRESFTLLWLDVAISTYLLVGNGIVREQKLVLVSCYLRFHVRKITQQLYLFIYFYQATALHPGLSNPDLVTISYSLLQFERTEGGSTLLYLR